VAKAIVLVLLAAVLQGMFGRSISAQNVSCEAYDTYCAACGDPFLPGMHNCEPESSFIDVCALMGWWCPPSAAAAETRTACPTPGAPTCSKPISLASGDTFMVETDTKIPGLGGGLELTRTWHSMWPAPDTAYQIGIFGSNWRSTYEEKVFVGADNYLKYLRSDGSIWSFAYGSRPGCSCYSSGLTIAAPASGGGGTDSVSGPAASGGRVPFVKVLTNTYDFIFPNGEERLFSMTNGDLLYIIDKNGNTTSLGYDGAGRLSTVEDAPGRHLYFNYGSGTTLVSSVTTDFGVTISYTYDTNGRLTQVTEPDSATINFQYADPTSILISSVLDTNGHVLETHTYDSSNRGLTASQAGGVNAVTVSY
jgi:YD repeat-containing protein